MKDNSRTPTPNNPAGRVLHDLARHDVPDDRDLRAEVLRAIEQRRDEAERDRPAWSGPVIDPAARRRKAQPTTTSPDIEEYAEMNAASDATRDGPVPSQRRRWAREGLKLAAAIIFTTIGVVLALTLRDGDNQKVGAPPASPAPVVTATPAATVAAIAPTATTARTATPTAIPMPDLPALGTVVATIHVGNTPFQIASGEGAMWVTNFDDSTISRIDPATNQVVATIQVDGVGWIDVGDGFLWAASQDGIAKIDPATNQIVATIPVQLEVNRLLVADGMLWYSDFFRGQVVRVDPATGAELVRIPVKSPIHLTAADGAVWVDSGRSAQLVTKIDPATNSVVASVALGQNAGPRFSNDAGSLWIATFDSLHREGAVVRIDQETGQVVATIRLPGVINPGGAVTIGGGKVWVAMHSLTAGRMLWEIDPATNQPAAMLPLPGGRLVDILYAEGSLWVSDALAPGTVVRIDPSP